MWKRITLRSKKRIDEMANAGLLWYDRRPFERDLEGNGKWPVQWREGSSFPPPSQLSPMYYRFYIRVED